MRPTPFEVFGALLTASALFAYVNHRWLRFPPTTGMMLLALLVSGSMVAADHFVGIGIRPAVGAMVARLALSDSLLHGALGVMLFAGALHVDVNDLRKERTAIAIFALGSTVLATAVISLGAFVVLRVAGTPLSLGWCLLFGAVVAPTDPIGVQGILRAAGVPKSVETQIADESLFNDGIGVVLFLGVEGVLERGGGVTATDLLLIFVRQALGGIAFGLVGGYVAYRLLKSIDHYQTELLVTLALVVGGYALAERLQISGPLAAVASGLLIGNQGRALAMSDTTREHLDKFWSLVDEVLNALLFVLVGFEIIRLSLTTRTVLLGAAMVPVALIARLTSVSVPILSLRRWVRFSPGAIPILTWAGMRGGMSVALALSVPDGPERNLVVAMTYAIVLFSVVVQGLTLGRVVRRFSS